MKITVRNNDSSTSTGPFALAMSSKEAEELQLWFPDLDPSEEARYEYSFTPQNTGGYVLRATAGNDHGIFAREEIGLVVGEASTVAIDMTTEALYPAGTKVEWQITAVNAGTIPTSTVVSIQTYNTEDYFLVGNSNKKLTLGAAGAKSFTLDVLSDGSPGRYEAHLLVAGQIPSGDLFHGRGQR